MRYQRLAMALVATASILLTACSGDESIERAIESQEGVSDVEIDADSGEIEMETDDGSVVIGGGELPAGFPIDIPGGGEVQVVTETDEGTAVLIAYSSGFDDIVASLQNWIDSNIAEVDSTIESSSPPSISWAMQHDGAAYIIRVVEGADGTVQVAVNVAGT